MSLSEVIGQEKAISVLRGIMERGRMASSYLFCGEQGVGKRTVAVNFAKALNCLGAEAGLPGLQAEDAGRSRLDSCDVCESCLKIDGATHPDILMISPEERYIRIEEVRLVNEALSYRPYEGRMKVVIIDNAEAMNAPASNAFLKTLEEPPADSVIILVSGRPDLLPATIRSRCSRINFGTLSPAACRQVIGSSVPESDLDLVSRLAMGRPGEALSADLAEERAWFIDLFKGMLRVEKDAWTSREDMERWLEYAMTFLRDLAVQKISGNSAGLLNIDLADYLADMGKSPTLKGIIDMHAELSRLKRLLMFNLNKSVTWNYASSLLRKEFAGPYA